MLLSYERQLRDRNSQMEAPGADFRPLCKLIDQADQRQAVKQQPPQVGSAPCVRQLPRSACRPAARWGVCAPLAARHPALCAAAQLRLQAPSRRQRPRQVCAPLACLPC